MDPKLKVATDRIFAEIVRDPKRAGLPAEANDLALRLRSRLMDLASMHADGSPEYKKTDDVCRALATFAGSEAHPLLVQEYLTPTPRQKPDLTDLKETARKWGENVFIDVGLVVGKVSLVVMDGLVSLLQKGARIMAPGDPSMSTVWEVIGPEACAFVDGTVAYLEQDIPHLVNAVDAGSRREMVLNALVRGQSYGLSRTDDLHLFANWSFSLAPNFHLHPVVRASMQKAVDQDASWLSSVQELPDQALEEAAANYDGWFAETEAWEGGRLKEDVVPSLTLAGGMPLGEVARRLGEAFPDGEFIERNEQGQGGVWESWGEWKLVSPTRMAEVRLNVFTAPAALTLTVVGMSGRTWLPVTERDLKGIMALVAKTLGRGVLRSYPQLDAGNP